jgi:DamX protein
MLYALGGLAVGGVVGIAAFAAFQTMNSQQTPPATAGSAAASRAESSPAPAQPMAPAQPPAPLVAAPANVGQAPPAANSTVPPGGAPSSAAAKPASIASAASPQAVPSLSVSLAPDLLEQRLLATEQWLGVQSGANFSIQLLGTNDPELLRDYFKTIAKYLEIEKVYVYRTIANKRPSLTVLYGTFADRGDVSRTLDGLPQELKANRPYYRTIQGIRSELARYKS